MIRKAILSIALLGAPQLFAQGAPASGLDPVMSQAEFNDAMWCIGRFEGGMDGYRTMRPMLKNPAAVDQQLELGKQLQPDFALIASVADDPSQQLDKSAAEVSRAAGRKIFDDAMLGPPADLWALLGEHGGFSEDCSEKLVLAIGMASLHEQASAEIAAARAGSN